MVKWFTQVKNIDVNSHELGIGCGDNTIPHYFVSGGVGSGRADALWVINEIAPNI